MKDILKIALGQKAYKCLLFFVAVSVFSLNIAIKEFFEYFRATIPEESITLKMHIMEMHILPQIKSTGFVSEQGTVLLHRR